MRNTGGCPSGLGRGLLFGVLVTAVVMLSFPVVAAVGGNLILGQSNSADAVTSLSGSSTANLRITNTQAGAPALDLRVVAGAAPLKVNSTARVPNLNADRLDGKHAGAFALVAHTHAGVYLPVAGTAANSSLLDGMDSTAFASAAHSHDASYLGLTAQAADSDLLDGQHAAAFALVGHSQSFSTLTEVPAGLADGDDDSLAGLACATGQVPKRDLAGTGWVCAEDLNPTNADTLDGLDSLAFSTPGMVCPPGGLVGYSRLGPVCYHTLGSLALDTGGKVGQFTSLVLDGGGRPVVAYFYNNTFDLKLLHCGDTGCSAGNTITTVDSTGVVGEYASLVLDGSGRPVVAHYDETNGDLKLVHCGDATCSAGNTITIVDSGGDVGQFLSLALDPSGRPVIAYHDVTNRDLKLVRCGDATCSAGNTFTIVDGGGMVGLFTSLVLDGAGRPVIAYYDITNNDLKVAHCGDATCSAGNTITTVDSGGTVGLYTSLVLDASGYPAIAYFDDGSDDLKLVRCGDANCSAGNTITILDGANNVGMYASLVLDTTGSPIIAYYDNGNADLKLVRCGNATCSAGNTIITLDGANNVGEYLSMVLDGSGNPLISYFDATNGDLRLAAVMG